MGRRGQRTSTSRTRKSHDACKSMTLYTPSWPVYTERLLLRPFEDGDLQAMYEMQSDEAVVRYLYHDARSLDEVRTALARKIAAVGIAGEGDGLGVAVVLTETGEVVADLSLWCVSEGHQQGEMGFIVHPAHQRKGYATEAARPMLDFAFGSCRIAPRGRTYRGAEHRIRARARKARHATRGAFDRERVGKGRVAK